MGKYLKVIGFLVLALALWQTSGAAFTVSGAVSAEDSMNIRTVTAAHYQDEAYIFSLKDWVDKLAQREAVLSLHREKLYDATAYYRCQPVCEYYIFTLRRILI